MTQAEFAELLGVTRKTIVNYESGSNIPESKERLFTTILNERGVDLLGNLKDNFDKIAPKFKNINKDEFALYFQYNKKELVQHPLIKSIIKSEAWEIIEKEFSNEAISKGKRD